MEKDMNIAITPPPPGEIVGECRRIRDRWSTAKRHHRRRIAELRQQALCCALLLDSVGPRNANELIRTQTMPSAMIPVS